MKALALFDIDKTLIKSSTGHQAAFSIAFREVYGVDTNIDVIQGAGMTDQQIIYEVLKLNGLGYNKIKAKIGLCMETMISAFMDFKNDNVVILDGVKELLAALEKNNVLMGLVTGNLEPIGKGKMKQLSLNHYFKVGGFGDEHISRTELVKIVIKKLNQILILFFLATFFYLAIPLKILLPAKKLALQLLA